MSSVIALQRVLPEFYKYGKGTLIWRVLYKQTHTYVRYIAKKKVASCSRAVREVSGGSSLHELS